MDITTIGLIAQSVITIATGGYVIKVLKAQIQAQKDQIIVMQSNMASMKAYIDIFKPEDVEKYVETIKKTLEAERLSIEKESFDLGANIATKLSGEVIKELKEYLDKTGNELLENIKENGNLNLENVKLKHAVDLFIENQNLDKKTIYEKIYSQTGIISIPEYGD